MEVVQVPAIYNKNREATHFIVRDFPSDKLGLSPEFCENGIYKGICEMSLSHTLNRIKHGCNPNIICAKSGNTLLHVILAEASPMTETKYVPFVYQLSFANVNFDVINKGGLSPLRMSIKMHLLELMIALIKCGATCDIETDLDLITSCSGPVEYEFRAAYRKFAPGYWTPVEEDNAFKVNVLVKSWCRINIQKNGKSLIEFAKEKGAQEKIVKMLIENEVTMEFAHATIAGDAERMHTLLQHYTIDLDSKDYSHRENFFEPYCPLTLYGAALKYGHKHVLHLLKYSGDITVKRLHGVPNSVPVHSQSTVCIIL
ncbi:uncharacterized protein LOC123553253 [Mercenaria mercenaria]|uniref:uncharacterized protein LOC123553253 n=1 Tax=Mercenaria mercenaria TaxID=6596 RepID=UPI00234EBC54|nr:uncharacterized protein LOC123553253 [Mercenaria mercenaria]